MLADMEQAAADAQQASPGGQAQRNHRGAVLYGLINILSAVQELLEDRLRASGLAVRKKSRFSWVVREAAAHRLVTDQEERDLFGWLTMRDLVAHLPTQGDVDAVLSAVPSFVGGVRRIVERAPR